MLHRIIGIVGLRCAGKATASEYLAQKTGYRRFDISDDIVWPLARERGITDLEQTIELVKTELTDEYMNSKTAEIIDAGGGIVVSSLRRISGYEFLKQRYGDEVALLYLSAPADIRFQRSLLRKRKGDKKTFAEFQEYEAREMEQYKMGALVQMASVVVDNSGTKDELFHMLNASL